MSSKGFSNNKKDDLAYVKEYSQIKKYLENKDIKTGHNYIISLQETFGKTISAHDKQIIDLLTCQLNIYEHKITENLELISKLEGKITEQLMQIDFTLAKAITYRYAGKYTESLLSYDETEKKLDSYKNVQPADGQTNAYKITEREADLQNGKGATYLFMGDVLKANESFHKSLRLREKLPNKRKIADTLNNLGLMYMYQGELQLALDHLMKTLSIDKELDNTLNIAYSHINMGKIYQYMGEYDIALNLYEQAHRTFESIGDDLTKTSLYYQFVSLYIEWNNIPEAQVYLDKLKLYDQPGSDNFEKQYIHLLYLLSEGLVLKESKSLMVKFKAAENFQQIANGPVIDSEFTALAILNLNDILLLELKLTQNDERLEEIQEWLKKLNSLAEEQKSSVLLVQTYLLESKLKLLEFKIQEAETILLKAQEITNQKGLRKFEHIITTELNKLHSQEEQWENLRAKDASLPERIDLAGLEKTFENLIRKRQDRPELMNLILQNIESSVQNRGSSTTKNEQIMKDFYKIISNETYITIYKQSEIGPEIFVTDELRFSKTNKVVLETKLGVFFMTAVGQGSNSNEGLFGPLPFPDSPEYVSIIYACFINDPENVDPRAKGKTYCILVLTFPKTFEPYYANRHFLTQIFENFTNQFEKLQDITNKSLGELKITLIT